VDELIHASEEAQALMEEAGPHVVGWLKHPEWRSQFCQIDVTILRAREFKHNIAPPTCAPPPALETAEEEITIHEVEEVFKCQVEVEGRTCGRTLHSKRALRTHVRQVHSGVNMCSFFNPHERVHSLPDSIRHASYCSSAPRSIDSKRLLCCRSRSRPRRSPRTTAPRLPWL
jgi:hypothetical protein